MAGNLIPVEALVPGANIDRYMTAVGSFPMLAPEQEKSLAEKLYYDGDVDAARQLVLSHLRFVVHVARSYKGYGLPLGDLIQEGNVGLMKAVRRFNPEVGVRLVSFAVHWIKAEIHEFILRNWRIVKVATTKAQRKLFFNLRGAKTRLHWLTEEETQAVAADLNVDAKVVREMEGRLAAHDAAFDGSTDDEEGYAPAHYLEDRRYDPAKIEEQADWREHSMSKLESAMGELDERSRNIVQSRWLGESKLTLHELAEKYNVSAERIRQLEAGALKKLKVAMDA